MAFGLPSRWPITTRLLVSIPLFGPAFQSDFTSPAFASISMSSSSDRTAMSAGWPALMARAWRPEPLYDSSNVTSRPVLAFQLLAKAGIRPSWNASFTTE